MAMKNALRGLALAGFVLAQSFFSFAKAESPVTHSDDPVVNYNAGVASYKKHDYKTAKENFTRALITDNKALETKTEYNIGNSLFKIAKASEASDVGLAMDALKQAAHYYQKAIELDPADIDAKYNHELSKKLLKIIEKRPKTQQQQKNRKEENQDKNNKHQQNKEQERQDQQDKQDQKNEQPQSLDTQEDKQEKKKEKNGEKPEQKEEKLSEEEARMLASQFGQENIRLDINKDKNNQERAASKDW
jgi:Ca-activated chloride channel family protein